MKVFISHALSDQELLKKLKESLEPYGLKLFIAEHYEDMERTVTEKIENMIRQSDVALVLLTPNGFNSHFVQQEIGYIKSLKIPFLQIIQSGIEDKIKGFNFGRDFVLLDPIQPNLALEKVKRRLLSHWNKMREIKIHNSRQQQIKNQSQIRAKQLMVKRQRENENAKLILGGLAALLVLGLATSK